MKVGICGKQPKTAGLQDALVNKLIALASAAEKHGKYSDEIARLLADGLFTTLKNVNFDDNAIEQQIKRAKAERLAISDEQYEPMELFKGETDIVSLRSALLFGMKGMAAYAHHAMNLGYRDDEVFRWFIKGISEIKKEHTVEQWLDLLMEFGRVNFKCMELLDSANTGTFGNPVPTRVNTDIKKGPFIVVSGHDLLDLYELLQQTEGKGINIYTHSEMLPAHGYPGLKNFPHLSGNFGTAWQGQQKEFKDIPAPVLFTTNCLMPPRPSYGDRVYTTSVVGYPGLYHISTDKDGHKDYTPVIEKALALADAFGCTVNELPLTLVLSWYEQKAVCILLTLLSLGIKNMYLGPTFPAFFSETVTKVLVDTFGLQPITTPMQDIGSNLNL